MDKSKSMKKGVIALLIFGLIAVICWAVFFVIFALNEKLLPIHLAQLLAMFMPWLLSMDMYLPNSIAVLSIVLLLVVAFVLMLVFSISKRRGIIILPFFLLLVSGAAVAEIAANFANYTLTETSTETGYVYYLLAPVSESLTMSAKIMAVAVIACAFIAVVIALVAFILSIVHACKYKKTGKKEIEKPEDDPEVVLDAEPVPAFQEEPVVEEEKPHIDDEKELMDKIRELIREEIRAAQQPSQPAVSFSAPLIVQYFNGMGPAQPAPAPAPEPKKEEPKPEPQPEPEPEPVVEEPAPEPVPEPEPAPVVEEPVPEPAPEPEPEKAKIIRIPFQERITSAEKEMKDNYNELKNDILAYGVKSRVSNSGDTFRLHRKTYVKLTIAGKSLKLYFALNPDDYKDSTIPVADASEKNIYQDIPLIFKVKSGLSMRRAKQLIADVMAPDGLVQGEVGKVNWVKEIAAEMKEGKKAQKDEDED